MKTCRPQVWLVPAFLMLGLVTIVAVEAQTGRPRKPTNRGNAPTNPVVTRAIDAKAQKLEESFIRDAATLAQEYAEAGDLEKSRELLKSILKINPKLPQVEERIKLLEEGMLQQNGIEYELDTGRGWSAAIAQVTAGKKIRVQVTGTYELSLDAKLDSKGFATGDAPTELAGHIPLGALMGMIVVKGKPERAFPIEDGLEFVPKNSGLLAVRVNVPPTARCSGKLKLELAGGVTAPGR